MKVSVIIPSFLGHYPTAAKNRDQKLIRAVDSVLNQTFQDFEIIVIADNCELTKQIIKYNYKNEKKIKGISIETEKHTLFAGLPRNTGIRAAKGEFITYLDADDAYHKAHLSSIISQLNGYDWVWFNDSIWDKNKEEIIERECKINIIYKCGTSNICHKRKLDVFWNTQNQYGTDDWFFICKLKQKSNNYTKIDAPGYIVCHIPERAGGYDI